MLAQRPRRQDAAGGALARTWPARVRVSARLCQVMKLVGDERRRRTSTTTLMTTKHDCDEDHDDAAAADDGRPTDQQVRQESETIHLFVCH